MYAISHGIIASSGGGFIPPSGLGLWYKTNADDGLVVTDDVDQINDLSGNGRNGTPFSSSNRPSDNVSPINGKRSIRFDGVTDHLSYNGSFMVGTQYTLFHVCRPLNYSNNYVLGGDTRTSNSNLSIRFTSTTNILQGQYSNDISANVPAMSVGDVHVIAARLNGSGRQMWKDGSIIGTTTNTTPLSDYPGAALARFRAVTGQVFSAQDFSEYLAWPRALTDNEVSKVNSYLISEWK